MLPLQDKKIIIGITGSIAAYKTAMLLRLLMKAGAEVKVIMTEAAHSFVTPTTLSTLSKNPVLTSFTKGNTGEWNNHVALGLWADMIIIAPLSANTLGKMANGICDNLLVATYLSARCPVMAAPAMDLDMYQHPSTKRNLRQLESDGVTIIAAQSGELASGLSGQGRMEEPERLFTLITEAINKDQSLIGKQVLITAGPTFEAIDPVRFIGNHSSGKMGFAIAETAASLGAKVILINGPGHLQPRHHNIHQIKVTSAQEMYQQAEQYFEHSHIAIFAAAVADYTPSNPYKQKFKSDKPLEIKLKKTIDIALELGKKKREKQITVGFALETESEETHAYQKAVKKNFDFVVLNSLNDEQAGFNHDTNKVSFIDKDNNIRKFELKSKSDVAKDILNAIIQLIP